MAYYVNSYILAMAKRILITGGAGFIGINSADYFLNKGYKVTILDNLSRKGAEHNLEWLSKKWKKEFTFVKADIVKDVDLVHKLVASADAVIHLAAQVAVTLSIKDPIHDFRTNAEGTLNILEAARKAPKKPLVIFASTNKVHGNMEHAKVSRGKNGYFHDDHPHGISDTHMLDFHSPYGCSKGSADQYVRDYARIFNVPTVVFRQSCIYGAHQFGMEDQGWVAWFGIRAILDYPAVIYGDGHQVRDVLYVDDLCRLYERAIKNPKKVHGHVYSAGGGPANISSVLKAIRLIEEYLGKKLAYSFSDWRPGDQKVYISDIRKLEKHLGWKPKVQFENGIIKMLEWAEKNIDLLKKHVTR